MTEHTDQELMELAGIVFKSASRLGVYMDSSSLEGF